MDNEKKIYFYTSNFFKKKLFDKNQIGELYNKIHLLFKNKFTILESENLVPNELNIVVEHFNSIAQIMKIVEVKKKYPNTKIILVLSEFINKDITLNSFHINKDNIDFYNSFFTLYSNMKYVKYLIHKFLSFFPIFFNKILIAVLYFDIGELVIPMRFVKFNKYGKSISLINIMSFIISFINILNFSKLIVNMWKVKSKLNYAYLNSIKTDVLFFYRYKMLKKLKGKVDLILKTHPKISSNLFQDVNQFNIFFDFQNLFQLNDLKSYKNILSFSGELNDYRKLKIKEEFDKKLNLEDKYLYEKINSDIKKILNTPNQFIDESLTDKKVLFNLHPKKTAEWPYSSPTRYYRSVENNTIPLTFASEHISDNFTNKSTIEVSHLVDFLNDFFKQKEIYIKKFNNNCVEFNKDSNIENKKILTSVEELYNK